MFHFIVCGGLGHARRLVVLAGPIVHSAALIFLLQRILRIVRTGCTLKRIIVAHGIDLAERASIDLIRRLFRPQHVSLSNSRRV